MSERGELEDRDHPRILTSFSWLAGSQLARLGLGIVVSVLLIRYLGPERFGVFSYVLALVGLFAAVPKLGLHDVVLRDLSGSATDAAGTLGTAALLTQLGGLLMLVLASATAWLTDPGDTLVRVGVAIVASGYLLTGLEMIELWLLSRSGARGVAAVRVSVVVATAGCKLALILTEAPLIWFFGAAMLDVALLGVGFGLLYCRAAGRMRWRWSAARALEMLSQGWPLLVSGAAMIIQARVDQVMLGQLRGAEAVGQYAAALRIMEAAGSIAVALHLAWAPALARARERGPAAFRDALRDLYRMMMLPAVALVALIAAFSRPLASLLYGDAYLEAGGLLALFSLRLLFTHQSLARNLFIANERLFRFAMLTALAGALTNVALNALWIPAHGGRGAILATLVSLALSSLLLDLLHPRARLHVRALIEAFYWR